MSADLSCFADETPPLFPNAAAPAHTKSASHSVYETAANEGCDDSDRTRSPSLVLKKQGLQLPVFIADPDTTTSARTKRTSGAEAVAARGTQRCSGQAIADTL